MSGGTSRSAACTSGNLPPAVFRGGPTNCPLQPTDIVSPGVLIGISLTHLSLCLLSGRVSDHGSTDTGAAERLEPSAAAPLALAAASGALPKTTEMTSEVLPVTLVRNNCT